MKTEMDTTVFGLQIDRLKKIYGERFYPDARVTAIYAWAKNMPLEKFSKIIDDAIANIPNSKPPMLADLKEIFPKYNEVRTATQPRCKCCHDRGQFMALSKSNPNDPMAAEDFACPYCEAGKSQRHLKYWQEHDAEKYTPSFTLRNLVKSVFKSVEPNQQTEEV